MPQAIGLAIGSLLFNLGAPLAVVNFFAIGGGTAFLLTGASLLANYALTSALTPNLSTGPNDNSVKGNVRSSTAPQRIIYGRQRVGGAICFVEQKPPYLYLGLVLCARQITSVDALYIGDQQVPIGADGNAYQAPFYDASSDISYIKASYRLGTDAQAIDPLIAADFPSLDTNFRQRGHATAYFRFHYGADVESHQALWGNVLVPTVSLDVSGVSVYDPRDPSQSRDDATTWKWSDNAALCATDYLCADYGGRVARDRIDWDRIAETADYCDELVGLKAGGFQKRWTINGVVSLDQTPFDIFNAMLVAFRGRAIQYNGKVWIESSRAKAPSFTVHRGNLAGGLDFRDSRPKKDLLNTVRTRFVAPDREYQVVDGPVIENEDYLTEDDEELAATLESTFTVENQRVQRLAFAALEESRIGRTLAVSVKLDRLSLKVKAGDVVTVDLPIYGMVSGTYQVTSHGFSDDFSTISLSLDEYDGSIDGRWLPDTMEQDFALSDLDVS